MSTNDTSTNATATPSPVQSPPAPRPQLRRSGTDRVFTGVAGGLAEHTGIDTILFRVGFVVLTLAGGTGVLIYLVLWAFLPDANGREGVAQRLLGSGSPSSTGRTVLLVLAGAVALVLLLGGIGHWNGGLLGLLAVGALAYLLVRDRDTAPREPRVDPALPANALPPPSPPVMQRSRLGSLTLSVLLIVIGVLALVDLQTGFDLSMREYLAVAVAVVGVGLVVGTIWGRSRGLIALGIVLSLLLAGAASAGDSLRAGVGNRDVRLFTAGAVDPSYRLGIGNLRILVPPDVDVRVVSDLRAGALSLFGTEVNGTDLHRSITDNGADGPGGGGLDLAIRLGLGRVELVRVG